MIDIGKMKHRVELQTQTQTTDEQGISVVSPWSTQRTVWARVEPFSGREYVDDRKITTEATHRITLRWQPGIDLTPAWRVLYGEKTFQIESVINIDERDETWVLIAKVTE